MALPMPEPKKRMLDDGSAGWLKLKERLTQLMEDVRKARLAVEDAEDRYARNGRRVDDLLACCHAKDDLMTKQGRLADLHERVRTVARRFGRTWTTDPQDGDALHRQAVADGRRKMKR